MNLVVKTTTQYAFLQRRRVADGPPPLPAESPQHTSTPQHLLLPLPFPHCAGFHGSHGRTRFDGVGLVRGSLRADAGPSTPDAPPPELVEHGARVVANQ